MRRYLFSVILLSGLCLGARGQTELVIDQSRLPEQTTASSLRYWFDTDANSIKTTSTLSGTTIIDASALVDGMHTVHYQIVDDKGNAGIPASAMFVKMGKQTTTTATKLRYWFDSDNTTIAEKDLTGTQTIDASTLVDGIHILHYQIVDDQGTAGISFSAMFMKLGQKAKAEATAILYWFDEAGDDVKESDIANLSTTIDARPLKKGEHVLHYQLKLNDGTLSPAASVIFDVTALRGDANGDGKVTITDAVSVVNYILGNPADGFDIEAANVNGDVDGEGQPSITITDAVGIVNIILEGGSSAPKMESE